jgi:hypothetical protein
MIFASVWLSRKLKIKIICRHFYLYSLFYSLFVCTGPAHFKEPGLFSRVQAVQLHTVLDAYKREKEKNNPKTTEAEHLIENPYR